MLLPVPAGGTRRTHPLISSNTSLDVQGMKTMKIARYSYVYVLVLCAYVYVVHVCACVRACRHACV